MRLSEAAAVLGVDQNADKQTIEKAARQQIRKWHPDRWRNASEAEQKKASEEYSKVSKAQQVMQHPETADPEIQDIPSPSSYGHSQQQTYPQGSGFPDGYDVDAMFNPQSQYRPQPQRPTPQSPQRPSPSPFDSVYQGTANDNRRVKYNEATNFEDTFGAIPDTMEQQLNTMHNTETAKRYQQFADVMKMSMSVLASVVMFFVSFVLLIAMLGIVDVTPLASEGTFGGVMASILPATSGVPSVFTFGILTVMTLLKIISYDAFIAPLLARKISAVTPSVLCGMDLVLCGIVGYALSGAWPVPRFLYGTMILFGILFAIVAVVMKLQREAR